MINTIATRAINKSFFDEFESGNLKSLLEVIQKDGDLIMCLRGNYTSVYYRGLQILKIEQKRVHNSEKEYKYIYEFTVHKHYDIDMVKVIKSKLKNKEEIKILKINNKELTECNNEDWIEYFKEAKHKINTHCEKKPQTEKEIQQLIFRENSYNKISEADQTDYFIFDVEYCCKTSVKIARFDALAIFWPKIKRGLGGKVKLAIIELKAGKGAIDNKAGLKNHYSDVKDFLENIDKEAFLEDMKNVFSQMVKLKLIKTNANPEKIYIDKEKIQFILAIADYNDNSVILKNELEKIKEIESVEKPSFEMLFATSSFLGYGFYEKFMINSNKLLKIIEEKSPKLIIHRGTQEIGGCAVEVSNGNTKLLFDFGIPLDSMVKESYKLEEYKLPIKGLYKDEIPEFSAVFLTHAHPDHFGLLGLINKEIPIYVSKTTYDILTKINPLLPKANAANLNFHIIEDDIDFENIKVKAHRVDHSIAGACAYEIKMNGKSIVYTGDLRFHGRASWQSSVFKKSIKNPDYLIMEGTTLGRTEQKIVKEEDLEADFVKIFKGNKLPLIQFSPQNIDRLVTVYRACKRTGKTLVIDAYTAYVLEVYSSLSKNIPQFDWENIMVNFAQSSINNKLAEEKILFRYKNKKITLGEIIANPEKFVIKGNWTINKQIFDAINHDKLEIIFSMWKGYLDRPNQFDDYKDIKITPLHTSGHAYIEDLQKLVETMKPKILIPIHTECREKYKELFNAEVIVLNDGDGLKL